MIRKSFIIILSFIFLSFSPHKFYISIIEAEFNETNQAFEISIKFQGHDLEYALKNAGIPDLYLGTEKEIENANDYLKQYIEEKFQIIVNEKNSELTFIGKEVYDNDVIYCYLETSKIPFINKITLKNSLLIELFEEQINLVYLEIRNKNFNFIFNYDKTTEYQLIN